MRQRERRATPADVELESGECGGGGAERIERREDVVPVAGLDELRRLDGPARLASGVEHENLEPRVGEPIGGHEPVRSRTDHDRVRHCPILP